MAERDQLVRALGGHDAGEPGRAEHVALLGVALADQRQGLGLHDDAALRPGGPVGRGLVGDVDHVGRAAGIEVGERRARLHRSALHLGLAALDVRTPPSASPKSSARVAPGDVRLSHQALADQDRAEAVLAEPRDVGVAADAALGDGDPVRGIPAPRRIAVVERDLEGLEVAVVDADQARCPSGMARASSASSWTSTSTSMPRSWAVATRVDASSSSRQAMMTRMQSAPQARASKTW